MEIDEDTGVITGFRVPWAYKVERLDLDDHGNLRVRLQPSHAIHLLLRSDSNFDAMRESLQAALADGSERLITETRDEHEIIDVRQLEAEPPESYGPAPSVLPDPPVSEERAGEVFNNMNAESCSPCNPTSECIPFMYPDDGCWIPFALTTLGRSPSRDDVVRYGGKGADGKIILTERVYTWRERYFGGLDWSSLNDIKDGVHMHLSGDYADDSFDPYNYLNFAGKYHALVLLLVYIISPDERTTRIALRHDDAVRVWLNGEEVRNDALPFLLDHEVISEDETFAEISLRSGTNILLAAVAETHTDWGFSARIEDYEGLRITTGRPDRDPIVASDSQYYSVSITGGGNLWHPYDLNRALTCVGKKKWKGRVKMADEHFKIVGHRHHWIPDWWGPNGLDIFLDNFHNEMPGVYDIMFFEDNPTRPVLILVKPFAAR